jgi:hypothetical protein
MRLVPPCEIGSDLALDNIPATNIPATNIPATKNLA